MKKQPTIKIVLQAFIICFLLIFSQKIVFAQNTIVEKYGQLRIAGNKMVDKNGNEIQLRGMSLYWSQWQGGFYNYNAIKWLRDDWKVTVVRAALAINGTSDGYLVNPSVEKAKIFVRDAGKVIMVISLLLWFLSSYGPSERMKNLGVKLMNAGEQVVHNWGRWLREDG